MANEPYHHKGFNAVIDSAIAFAFRDLFLSGVLALAAVAIAVSASLFFIGDGSKATIGIAAALIFGFLAYVGRVLVSSSDNRFVLGLAYALVSVITLSFCTLIVLSVSAVSFCAPKDLAKFFSVDCPTRSSLVVPEKKTEVVASEKKTEEPTILEYDGFTNVSGTYLGQYPKNLLPVRRQSTANEVNYLPTSPERSDLYSIQAVTFQNASKDFIETMFWQIRNMGAKSYTYCMLKQTMFVIAYHNDDGKNYYVMFKHNSAHANMVTLRFDKTRLNLLNEVAMNMVRFFLVDFGTEKIKTNKCQT